MIHHKIHYPCDNEMQLDRQHDHPDTPGLVNRELEESDHSLEDGVINPYKLYNDSVKRPTEQEDEEDIKGF